MSQKFLSPGVFSTEIDQSFLAQGVAGIGAAVVGRTQKGPAFLPVMVRGFDDFVAKFGNVDPNMQMTYAAKNYLRNSGAMTIVRVLGSADGTSVLNGYTMATPGGVLAIVDMSASTVASASALATVQVTSLGVSSILGVAADTNNFVFKITNSGSTVFAATASFLSSSANYIKKVLNTDPTKFSTYGHWLDKVFSYATPRASASWQLAPINSMTGSTFQRDFSGGTSAWVKSQNLGGTSFNLFRFKTIPHGRSAVNDVKVMISNVKPSPNPLSTPYGTFDVVVRSFDDSDQRMVAVENYVGCTLDPNAASFVARRIGDVEETFDSTQRKFISNGTFPNKSKKIRVEMNTTDNAPKEALPWGHRGYTGLAFASGAFTVDLPLTINQYDRNGNIDANVCFGISFVSGGIEDRMHADPNSPPTETDVDFSLDFLTSSYSNGKQIWKYDTTVPQSQYHAPVLSSASLYKFVLPFQGGFDGWDIRTTDPLYLSNSSDETTVEVLSVKRAIDCLANPDAFDMNLLAIPGVHNLKITDRARTVVNDRMDAMFVMDITGSTVAEAIGNLTNRQLDDNYTACYYPDLRLNDKTNARFVRVSPSVAVLGAIAFSDRVGQVFFAPAGLNRGGLAQFDIVDVTDRLTFQDRNDLYESRINPIATFPNEGIVVFGQKTLQIKASALDRINVRRLLIFAKKTIAAAAKFLLFEPNNPATWQRFTTTVNPILERIRQDNGVLRFKVVMDTTVNTDDLVDRNIMTGKIYLQPSKASEFIDLSFVITNSGVSFGE